jgi:NADPH:quinone reductase-like Zn-dependent oxidoreductase
LPRSFQAIGYGGKVALIGFLAGPGGDINPGTLMMKAGNLLGINVGSTRMFEDMNRAIEWNQIKPAIDRVFPFDEAPAAFRTLASGDFVGKLVVQIS